MFFREACCGTHAHRTGVLEHFCITYLKSQGNVSVNLKAVAGSTALSTRSAGDNLRKRISNLKLGFKSNSISLNELMTRVANEKRILMDKNKRTKYPYVVVQECWDQLESLSKNISMKERGLVR